MSQQGDFWKGVAFAFIIVLGLIALAFMASEAFSQTPPVSTVTAMADTTGTMELEIHFTVESSIAWDQAGGTGIYYRIPGVTDWLYVTGSYTSPVTWSVPVDERQYEFASTTTDNNGNNEGHDHQPEASTYVSTAYSDGGVPCPPPSVLQAVAVLAENGFTSWGQPNEPKVRWWWTHPDTGAVFTSYSALWEVVPVGTCDTTRTPFDGIAVGDTTFAIFDAPYTYGASQRLRVQAVTDLDVRGPWSEWGDPFVDAGMPGKPGDPSGTLILVDPNE